MYKNLMTTCSYDKDISILNRKFIIVLDQWIGKIAVKIGKEIKLTRVIVPYSS